jgi:uncharacterized protein YuzE
MKIHYDQDVDILRILLTDAAIEESDEAGGATRVGKSPV